MLILVKIILQGLCRGVSKAADCKRAGKFPNDDLSNCRGFTTCTPIGTGIFYSYNLQCPANFTFNHIDKQCSNATGYRCFSDYNCTIGGNFDYSNNENCTSYVACVKGLSSIVTARLIDCPLGQLFSPAVGQCVAYEEYICLRNIISTTTTVDPGTEMFFIYNNNVSVTEVSREEFPVNASSSTILRISFRTFLLPLLTAYFVCIKGL